MIGPARLSRGSGRRSNERPRHSLAEPGTPFAAFVAAHRKNLQQIASATKGDHRLGDVVNEAWMLGHELAETESGADFRDPVFCDRLLRHLYQALVRYTDLHVRHAVRLDPSNRENAADERPNLLLRKLAAADAGPLAGLLAGEDVRERAMQARNERGSLAEAWLVLLERHRDMRGVAAHLLISRSHAYRCCAWACRITTMQRPMASGMPAASQVGPWRRFRAVRVPLQYEFSFEAGLAFPDIGSPIVQAIGD